LGFGFFWGDNYGGGYFVLVFEAEEFYSADRTADGSDIRIRSDLGDWVCHIPTTGHSPLPMATLNQSGLDFPQAQVCLNPKNEISTNPLSSQYSLRIQTCKNRFAV
jgi:hypothetical protein